MLLAAASAPGQATLYWDTNGAEPGSGDLEGIWQLGWSNWNAAADGTGEEVDFADGDSAVFSAGTDGLTAKTITLYGKVATPLILLEEDCLVTLDGSTDGAVDITGGATFDTSALGIATGKSLVWNPVVTGTGALTLKAHGSTADTGGGSNSELTLSGANDFIGTVTITGGLVSLASGFGDASNTIVLDGGGVVGETTRTSAYGIQAGPAGAIVRAASGATVTLTGPVANAPGVPSATLRKTDTGTLRLSGDGSGFTGTVTNARGELQVGAADADWSGAAFVLDPNGGSLVFNGGGTARAASVSVVSKDTDIANGTTLDVPAYFINPTAGSGMNARIGATAAANGFLTSSTGTLTITNGQFAAGAMGTNSNIVYVTVMDPDGATPLALHKYNNNDLKLARANTHTGGTIIHAGRIEATHPGGFGAGKVTVDSGAQAFLSLAGAVYDNDFNLTGNGVVDGTTDKGALRLGNTTASGTVTIAAAGARIAATTGLAGKLTGALVGTGPLEVNSSGTGVNGTVSLLGPGSGYTGTLTLSQGRFNFSGTLGGSVVVNPSTGPATLGGGSSIAGSLTLDSTANTVTYVNSNGPLAVGGNLVLTGTSAVSLAAPAPGTSAVTLITYGGSLTGTAANLALANAASYRGTPTFTVGGGSVRITGLEGRSLTWSGASGAWDVQTTPNWNNGADTFWFGDAVTFTDAGTTKTVTMAAGLEPHSVTVNNSAGNDYTLTGGGLAGATTLAKSGTGALTLAGTNSFTGTITVAGGLLKMGSREAFGRSSAITIAAGGQVDINGQLPGNSNTFTNGYTYLIAGNGPDGTGAIVNTGASVENKAAVKTLVLAADASLGTATRFDVGSDPKAGTGSVDGRGFTLAKKGAGDVFFRGPATAFQLAVEAGRAVAMDSDLAFGGPAGAVTVHSGARLATHGNRTIATPVTFNDGATLANDGTGTGTWTGLLTVPGGLAADLTGGDIVLGGGMAGAGTLTVSGSNTLVLDAAASPFTGRIVVNSGTLRVASDAALGAPPPALVPDAITLNGGALRGGTAAGTGSATFGHPNRGITLAPAYGWNAGAGNTVTLDSPVFFTGGMSATAAGTMVFNQPVVGTGNVTVTTGAATFNGGLDPGTAEIIVQNNGVARFGGPATASTLRMMTATLNIGPGAAVSTDRFVTNDASGATSTVNQTGGTMTITGTNSTNSNMSSFQMGHWSASTACDYNLSGGTLNCLGAVLSMGWDSSNVNITQTGGTANLLGINLNNERNYTATYSLNGGRLNLGPQGITPNAVKTINLGGGTLGAYADWSSAQPLNLTGDMVDATIDTLDSADGSTPRTITLSGSISGSGGLVKTGAGTLVLAAPLHSYYGPTTVNAGTLHLAGDLTSSDAIVNPGGTLALGTPDTPGTGTVGSLTLDGGTLALRLAPTGGDLLVTSAWGFTVASPSVIRGLPAGQLEVGAVIPLIDYDTAIDGLGFDGLALQMANPHFGGELIDNTEETTVDVKITHLDSLLWAGTTDGTWDVETTSNWKTVSDGAASLFYTYDAVRFTDAGATRPNVTLAGSILPGQVEFDSTADYTLGGDPLAGTTGLTKKNTGKLTLTNDNTWTGATTIGAGTLEVGDGATAGSLGATTITNNGTLALNRSDAVTLAQTIGGSGQLVCRGTGQVTLTGANTFTGEIVVESGTLVASNVATAFGTTAGGITVKPGATLALNNQTLAAGERVTLAGTGVEGFAMTGGANGNEVGHLFGNLVLTGNATIGGPARIDIGDNPAPRTITGAFTLTKDGGGTTWYRGPENGAGNSLAALVVNGGTFGIEAGNNALNGVPVTVNPGGILSSWAAADRATPTTQNNPVTLHGGALASDFPGQTWTGPVTLTADSFLSAASASSFTATGAIGQSGGSFGLTKATDSTVTLAGVNTYTGNTTIEAGTLVLADTAALTFVIGDNGRANKVTGAGTATLNGDFILDLSGADPTPGNAWILVDAATTSFGPTFSISGFTEAADVHTLTTGDQTWTFSEATGVLTLPGGGDDSFADWIDDFYPGETNPAIIGENADPDRDGLSNRDEYAFGLNPASGASASPITTPLDKASGTFTYTRRNPALTGMTYTIETSTTLAPGSWSPDTGAKQDVLSTTNDIQTVRVTLSPALLAAPRRFARVVASSGGTGTDPYDLWTAAQFPGVSDPAVIAPTADPDRDGLPNAVEFVLGENPSNGTIAAPPRATATGNNLVFTFRLADHAAAYPSRVWQVEFDHDLSGPWTVATDPGNATISVTPDGANPWRIVTVAIPRNTAPVLFARLKVVIP